MRRILTARQITAFVIIGIVLTTGCTMFWNLTTDLGTAGENYALAQVVRLTTVITLPVVYFGSIAWSILRNFKKNGNPEKI